MNQESSAISQLQPTAEFRTIDLSNGIRLIWRGRFLILGYALAGGVLAAILAYTIRPAFDATVRLMPPDHAESVVASLSITRNTGDLYLGLISSRTVADDVIEHQRLADYFHTNSPSVLRARLAAIAKIETDKDQFVSVTVRAKEPETATRIANEFPAALYRLNHAVALSKALHRWEYFEGPLEQESQKLADAEEQLKEAQQKTGVVMPEAQVQLGLSAIAALKAQITSLNGQLAALRTGSTDQDPQVIRLKTEIAALTAQQYRLEAQNGGSGHAVNSADLPALTLEVERKAREVKLHETLFEVLTHQYENARVEDSYSPPIELVDSAVVPDRKSFPPRTIWMLIGLFAGGLLGLVAIFLREAHPVLKLRAILKEDSPPTANRA